MANKKTDSVLVQAGILAAASMVVRIIGLLYRAPLTAIIGDEGNGYYGIAYNIYTIILMVSSYSVPSAVSKLMAQKLAVGEYKGAERVFHCALIYGFTVGTAASILLFFHAETLVPPVAAGVLRVFAPTVFLFGLLGSLRGYFQAHGTMVQTSISQILEQIMNAGVSIGAAAFLMHLVSDRDTTTQAQFGAMGSALGTGSGVLTALLFVAACYWRYHRWEARKIKEDRNAVPGWGVTMRQTIQVITPFMLSGFILNLTTSLNQTVYTRIMIGSKGMDEILTTTQYGIFSNKAVVISNIPISIATAVAAAIIPGISAAYAMRNLDETRKRSDDAFRVTLMIAIPSAAGLAALARPITLLMFPQMASLPLASGLLSMLAVTVVFYSASTITNAVLQSIGKMNMPLISAGLALIIQTIVLIVLLRWTAIGVYSLVIVSVLYSALIFFVNEWFLRKYLKQRRDYMKSFGKPCFCAAIMAAGARGIYELLLAILLRIMGERLYFCSLIALGAAIFAAVFIYFFVLIRTGAMTEKDIRSLPGGISLSRALRSFRILR